MCRRGQQAELDRLAGHRKGAGDDRLAGDDGRDRRQRDQRKLQRRRAESEERIARPPDGASITSAVWPA